MQRRKIFRILLPLLVIAILTPLVALAGGSVYVRGYTKKDGIYVAPHYRSAPDKSFSNNWSTKGNFNPYTGAPGTRVTPPASRNGHYRVHVPSYYDMQFRPANVPTLARTPNPCPVGTSEIAEPRAISISPAENAIKQGIIALQNGNEESAYANFSDAVRLDPKNPNAFLARALAFGLKSEWDNAIADCTEAIRLDPKNAFLGYFCRGDVYMKKHDYDKAIADYTKAIQLNPNNAGLYDSRGIAYEKKGKKSKADADFAEAKRIRIQKQHWQSKTRVSSKNRDHQKRIKSQKEKHERLAEYKQIGREVTSVISKMKEVAVGDRELSDLRALEFLLRRYNQAVAAKDWKRADLMKKKMRVTLIRGTAVALEAEKRKAALARADAERRHKEKMKKLQALINQLRANQQALIRHLSQ